LIGTTTILGGVLIEVERTEEEKKQGAPTHGFVAASVSTHSHPPLYNITQSHHPLTLTPLSPISPLQVGDCKAFLYSKSSDSMRDITPSSRTNVNDPMDPGGRLGPALPNDQPDLRNLSFYYCPCEPGDMIFLMSDGVYDNLGWSFASSHYSLFEFTTSLPSLASRASLLYLHSFALFSFHSFINLSSSFLSDPAGLGFTPRDLDLDLDCWDDKDHYVQVKLVKENFLNSFLRRRILYKEADLSSSGGVGTTYVPPLTPRTIVER
jgi:hypothetical protein